MLMVKNLEVLATLFILYDICSAHSNKLNMVLRLSNIMNKKLDTILANENGQNQNEQVVNVNAAVPETFEKFSSTEFIIDGVTHSQEAFLNNETGEVILTSPAHSGFSDITHVLSPKNDTNSAKIMTCDTAICHFNENQDAMHFGPKNIPKTKNARKERTEDTSDIKTRFLVRRNHRTLNAEEMASLSETMKQVSTGKTLLTSDIEVREDLPFDGFSFSDEVSNDSKAGPGRAQCKLRFGCASVNISCSYSKWSDLSLSQNQGEIPEYINQTKTFHQMEVNYYCSWCCANDDISLDDNQYVKCKAFQDDLEYKDDKEGYYFVDEPQSFYTGVSLSYRMENGKVDGKTLCFGPGETPEFDEECHKYGKKFGTCVDPEKENPC